MACPELHELEMYLSNATEDDSHAWIADHVRMCGDCQARLSELELDGPLERTIRTCFARMSAAGGTARIGAQLGAYRITRELGSGGMGVVYEAEQCEPRRRVALKLLHAAYAVDARYERLLMREARALARLKHPSIAAIHDAGRTHDGRPFFVMDLIEGEPFLAYARRRNLSIENRLELFSAVCDAVAHAHQRAVVHRDLKPSNILVDNEGRPTVLDFGLARILEPPLEDEEPATRSAASSIGRLAGTVPYMSPEHVSGQPDLIDVRSDVYSLGVLLYELLTGRLPYDLDPANLPQAARLIVEQQPIPPSHLMRSLRGDLETIVLKSLEKDPDRRYQSAWELAADLRRFLRREPIVARLPSAWYQLTRFAQRNRTLVAAASVALLATLGGAATAVVQAQIATRQRDAAERRMEYAQRAANYVFAGVGGQIPGVLGAADIQRHLAEEAYVFYRRLADESPRDLSAQIWLWMSLRRLAQFSLDVGDVERAQRLADMVYEAGAAAADDYPDDPRVLREQMHAEILQAMIASERGVPEIVAAHARRAAELRDRALASYVARGIAHDPDPRSVPQSGPLVGMKPEHLEMSDGWVQALAADFGAALASSEANLAAEYFREALTILDANEAEDPALDDIYRNDTTEYAPLAGPIRLRDGSRPLYERARARLYSRLGSLALQGGDVQAALEQLHVALTNAERQRTRFPNHPAAIALLASTCAEMERALHAAGDPRAADYATTARAAYQRLADADPANLRWQRALAALR